ncbi:hypothetical protein [Rhizobium rhizogenes]|uniref:hypothetical protein n=1 Tax=Rhizobium rhizogenes TaxID=359 RepID=UPI0015745C11|nr:hypothetical protein [Rhizobium rhizogenes]NTH23018.1 hypothetical protein [Rhizobium rhizogenes]NTH36048.1 hypothetical protein [Rhizobium rhizogenes]
MRNSLSFVQFSDTSPQNGLNSIPDAVRALLIEISTLKTFSQDGISEAFSALSDIPSPTCDVLLGIIMTAVMMLGPRVEDIVALIRTALSLDNRPTPKKISCDGHTIVAVAGSGKKGRRTLNLSTPATLVAATAGAKVVKVGSSATSSSVGSRDLVNALGLPEYQDPSDIQKSLQLYGFAFVAIEPSIPTLDCIYGGKFHSPNPFSFGLAPLVSPIRADITLFGLSHPRVDVAASALSTLGLPNVNVISTRLADDNCYVDEVMPGGDLFSCSIRQNILGAVETSLVSDTFGLDGCSGIPGAQAPHASVENVISLLGGCGFKAYHDAVVANAAYILVMADVCSSFKEAMLLANDVLLSGAALKTVTNIRRGGLSGD